MGIHYHFQEGRDKIIYLEYILPIITLLISIQLQEMVAN